MKYILAFSLILLLIGLTLTGSSFISEITYKMEFMDQKENADRISGYFKAGEKLIVDFTPSENWYHVIYPENEHYMYVYINITELQNQNETCFEVELYRESQGLPPTIYSIKVLKVGSLSLNLQANNQTTEIGGIVNNEGEYEALVYMIIPSTAGLPLTLTLWRGIPQTHYPYRFLLPPGISIIGLSIVLTIYYFKRRKRMRLHRKPLRKHFK